MDTVINYICSCLFICMGISFILMVIGFWIVVINTLVNSIFIKKPTDKEIDELTK